jgi:hypothetical protein
MIIPYDEYIWGDKFKADFSNRHIDVSYSNNPDILHVRNTLNKNSKIIITHNGDTPIWCDNVNEYPNCKFWFGQNIMCEEPKVIPLPIGLENDYISGQPLRKQILQEKSKVEKNPSKLLYLNCSINTCRSDRQPAYDYFSTKTWCTVKIPNHSNYYNFCDDILDHKFMVSPRGNGLDCHRSWEILYLNRYPVMKKYYGLQKLFEDLPVVFVDNWSDVTENYLNECYTNFKSQTFNYDKLKYSYWKNIIEKAIKDVI